MKIATPYDKHSLVCLRDPPSPHQGSRLQRWAPEVAPSTPRIDEGMSEAAVLLAGRSAALAEHE